MKKFIYLTLVAAIIFFVAGCGPGQPFEIESQLTPQSVIFTCVAVAG